MKIPVWLAVSVFSLVGPLVNGAQTAARSPAVAQTKSVALPYGVEDVLKLSRARVSEEIIVKYVQNSGTVYNLTPEVLVHLKEEGVADRVMEAMLDQRSKVSATHSATYWADQAAAQNTGQGQFTAPAQQPAPTYTQPPVPDPQPAPAPVVSTVHVIPHYRATYVTPYWPHYYHAPYAYSGWYGPRLSVGFGFSFGHGRYSRCW
jgi:hypothetical protein